MMFQLERMINVSTLSLWDKAVCTLTARLNATEKDEILGLREKGKNVSIHEASYYTEGMVALKLSKEVIRVQQGFRANAVKHLNRTGGFSRTLANSATDWPLLLLELLQTFGWTPQQAKVHMVPDFFSQSEWDLIVEVLGPNPRHLVEIYALKQTNYYQAFMNDKESTFEDIIDAYLGGLHVTVVNPAMDRALSILQKFALDAQKGKIVKDKLPERSWGENNDI